ncbi:hypothetical protein RDI58_023472 [Solanum bulbocastanum]
MIGRDP